ncbi:MAG: hypothetical protein LBQ23_03965 [Puniceicoccales bacterium]|jgi:hypothetical protein|nr:hypothetical protein [Puniceicoccales bacterium]
MKWRNFTGKKEVVLRVSPKNETYNIFRYEVDENAPVQDKKSCVEFNKALSSFEENTEVYCDWLQTLAEG